MNKFILTYFTDLELSCNRLSILPRYPFYDLGVRSVVAGLFIWPIGNFNTVILHSVKDFEVNDSHLSVTDSQDITIDYTVVPYIGYRKILFLSSLITTIAAGRLLLMKRR